MNIHVQQLAEKDPLVVRVQDSNTIAEVKTLIQESLGIAPGVQKLIHRKKELKNNDAHVAECGLSEGAFVILLVIPEPERAKEFKVEIDLTSHSAMEKQLEEKFKGMAEEWQSHGLNPDMDKVDLAIVLETGEVLDQHASEQFLTLDEYPSGARLRATFNLQKTTSQPAAKATTTIPKPEYEYLKKVLLVGEAGVGKSNFLLRFKDDAFTDTYVSTIGVDFAVKTIQTSSKNVKLQVWDTAGDERFRTITTRAYRGADAVIVMYDVCDRQSFVRVDDWLAEATKCGKDNMHKILVGNKCDMEADRVVTFEEGMKRAEGLGISFMETSAKEALNVEAAMQMIVKELLEPSDHSRVQI